jgi:hypothetical protein
MGSLRKYRSINANDVAAAMLRVALKGEGAQVLHYDEIMEME